MTEVVVAVMESVDEPALAAIDSRVSAVAVANLLEEIERADA